MEPREENRARDEHLDDRIEQMLSGKGGTQESQTAAEQMAREFARLAAEESPRMSNAARAQGLETLRARAAQKRAARRPNPFGFLGAAPRWAQIGAVALIVVILANGVSIAAADALPGSLLYPLKRITEDGQLLLQNSSGQRARLWMNLANTRLDELQRLLNSGASVDPSALDAVDESILRALTELAGTRGEERVALLQDLTALAIRQQQILQQMALNVSPENRARLEQTERLLQGVANYATSPNAASGPEISPFQFLTPTVTPTLTPTLIPTVTPYPTNTMTPMPAPTAVPSLTPVPAVSTDSPDDNDDDASVDGNDNSDRVPDVNNDDDNGTSNGSSGDDNTDDDGDNDDNSGNGNDDGGDDDSGDGDGGSDDGNDDGDNERDDRGDDDSGNGDGDDKAGNDDGDNEKDDGGDDDSGNGDGDDGNKEGGEDAEKDDND